MFVEKKTLFKLIHSGSRCQLHKAGKNIKVQLRGLVAKVRHRHFSGKFDSQHMPMSILKPVLKANFTLKDSRMEKSFHTIRWDLK